MLHPILRGIAWTLFSGFFLALPVVGALAVMGWPLSVVYGQDVWRLLALAAAGVFVLSLVLAAPGSFWKGPPPRPRRGRVDKFISRVVTGSMIGVLVAVPVSAVVLVIPAALAIWHGWGIFLATAIAAGIIAEGVVLRCVVRSVRPRKPESDSETN